MRSVLIWLTGHNPKVVGSLASASEEHDLAVMGVPVLFSAAVAGMCWAVAGYSLLPAWSHPWSCAVAGLMGVGLVIALDRVFLYAADTQEMHWQALAGFAILRVAVTLILSSLTAQAVMPILLNDELAQHRLRMIERDDQARHSELTKRLGVEEKELHRKVAADEFMRAQVAAKEPAPGGIRGKLLESSQCQEELRRNITAALGDDGTRDSREIPEGLRSLELRCQRLNADAQAALAAHRIAVKARLENAEQALRQAQLSASGAQRQRDQRVQEAFEAQSAATTETSATVLADLLRHDVGALVKWLVVTGLLLSLEVMPLLMKALRGRSAIGERMVRARAARFAGEEAHHEQVLMHSETLKLLAEAAKMGTEDALKGTRLRQHFEDLAADMLLAAAPVDSVLELSRKLGAAEKELTGHLADYPSHHALVEVLAKAVVQAANALNSSIARSADAARELQPA